MRVLGVLAFGRGVPGDTESCPIVSSDRGPSTACTVRTTLHGPAHPPDEGSGLLVSVRRVCMRVHNCWTVP